MTDRPNLTPTIKVSEMESAGWRQVDREYTYEELLEIFNENDITGQLVLRCQQYEAELARLRAVLRNIARCDPFGDHADAETVSEWDRVYDYAAYRKAAEKARKA